MNSKRLALVAVLAAGGISAAGCGSTGSTSTHQPPASPPSPAHTAPQTALGTATGNAFTHFYDQTKDKTAPILASDFTLWVSGKATNAPGAPPAAPLSTSEKQAAATVVLQYAQRLVAKGELSPNLPSGQSILVYLEGHGVN